MENLVTVSWERESYFSKGKKKWLEEKSSGTKRKYLEIKYSSHKSDLHLKVH